MRIIQTVYSFHAMHTLIYLVLLHENGVYSRVNYTAQLPSNEYSSLQDKNNYNNTPYSSLKSLDHLLVVVIPRIAAGPHLDLHGH